MGVEDRDPRPVLLSNEELKRLTRWREHQSDKTIARQLRVSTKTIGRCVQAGSVSRAVYQRLISALGFPDGPASTDPAAEIDELCRMAWRAHYERFDPAAAARFQIQLIGHSRLQQLPPEWLLERLMKSLSISRQWLFGPEQIFISVAEICLHRLSHLAATDKGERLAALVCGVAWEIAACVVQRGHAQKGLAYLDEVGSTIARLHLTQALPTGRLSSIAKMQHYARHIALAGKNIAPRDRYKPGRYIDELSQEQIAYPTERFNLLQHKFMELMSLALVNYFSAEQQVADFFEGQFLAHFLQLTNLIQHNGIVAAHEIITPATADAVALYSAIYADCLKPHGADDLLQRAWTLHTAVSRKGSGMINMQRANPQFAKAVHKLHTREWPADVPSFPLAADISDPTASLLLDYSAQVLAFAENCLTRTV
jgi:hypothetical protein